MKLCVALSVAAFALIGASSAVSAANVSPGINRAALYSDYLQLVDLNSCQDACTNKFYACKKTGKPGCFTAQQSCWIICSRKNH